MTQREQLLRAVWLAAMAAGGTLRIGPSLLQDYPGAKRVFVTTRIDNTFGDLIISAHVTPSNDDGTKTPPVA